MSIKWQLTNMIVTTESALLACLGPQNKQQKWEQRLSKEKYKSANMKH